MFLSSFTFLTCYNCLNSYLKIIEFLSYKVPCFRLLWQIHYVKSKHNVQEVQCKQSGESVWVKEVIIFGVRTIAPLENCPPVKVRVRVRVSFGVGEGAIFLGSNCPRPLYSVIGNNAQNSLQFALRETEQKNY